MKSSERMITERAASHALAVIGPPLLVLPIAALVWLAVFQELDRTLGSVLVGSAPLWVLGLVAGTALFTSLQLRHHPFNGPVVSQWLMAAGWDGQRAPHGLCFRLHWTECVFVAAIVAMEIAITNGTTVFALLCWLGIRTGFCYRYLVAFGEVRIARIQWMFWILVLPMLTWPFALIAVAVAIAVAVEFAQRRAMVEWARQALMTDPHLFPFLNENRPMLPDARQHRNRLRPWYELRPNVEDPRPVILSAIWTAFLVALWNFVAAFQVERLIFNQFSVTNQEAVVLAKMMALAAPVIPLAILTLERLTWYKSWKSSPGLWGRIKRRRFIVWRYDSFVLSLFPIAIVTALSLLPGFWLPVQLALSSGLCSLLLLRLGPNPADWQLTAPATL